MFSLVCDSFGLVRHINETTHALGHTLDRIMSYRLSINCINIEDASLSNHKSIVFNVILCSNLCTVRTLGNYYCCINPLTAKNSIDGYQIKFSSPDEFISLSCSSILEVNF